MWKLADDVSVQGQIIIIIVIIMYLLKINECSAELDAIEQDRRHWSIMEMSKDYFNVLHKQLKDFRKLATVCMY